MEKEKFKCPSCGWSENFRVLESIIHLAVPSEDNPNQIDVVKVVTSEVDFVYCGHCRGVVTPTVNFPD